MKTSLDKFLIVDGKQLQQFSQISPAQTPETSFVSETILQKTSRKNQAIPFVKMKQKEKM